MAELRWILLALGILILTGVYLWGRGVFRRRQLEHTSRREREEPRFSLEADLLAEPGSLSDDPLETRQPASDLEPDRREPADGPAVEPAYGGHEARRGRTWRGGRDRRDRKTPGGKAAQVKPAPKQPPDKIVTIRFIPKAHELDGEAAVRALVEAGLKHGRYGIFHMHRGGDDDDEPLFSVASLTEPGSFDLANLSTIAGMSFFVALPGAVDPVECFDAMVEAARRLAHELDADLFDDRGSSWSIQRQRYLREDLIRYRHQHVHP